MSTHRAHNELQDRLINVIKQLPPDQLQKAYDLLHDFRGTAHGPSLPEAPRQRPIGLAKGRFEIPARFFDPLPDELLDAFEGKS